MLHPSRLRRRSQERRRRKGDCHLLLFPPPRNSGQGLKTKNHHHFWDGGAAILLSSPWLHITTGPPTGRTQEPQTRWPCRTLPVMWEDGRRPFKNVGLDCVRVGMVPKREGVAVSWVGLVMCWIIASPRDAMGREGGNSLWMHFPVFSRKAWTKKSRYSAPKIPFLPILHRGGVFCDSFNGSWWKNIYFVVNPCSRTGE